MVPEGWFSAKIGEIANIQVGRDLKEEAYSEVATNQHTIPVFSNTVENRGLYGYYNFEEYPGNSVTIVGRGIGLGTAFSRKSGFGAIGRLLIVSPRNGSFDVEYLENYINFRLRIFNESGGIPQLPGASLAKYSVTLPPLSEQKKIARILSTWDKAIETIEKLIENSKAQKKALMQQLLTGKRRLPGFDEEWKTIRLDDVLDGKKRKGKIVPTNDEKRGVAYIGSTSFNGDFGIYTDSSDAVICSPKDILVLWDGENAGKATTGLSGAVSSTVVRCRIDESKANSRFITYNLLKDNYKVRAIREGSGIPHMPGDFEHWYHINLPPLKEQQEIAAILTSADKEIETLQQKLDYLKQEKKSLMQQILTGKRRVIIN